MSEMLATFYQLRVLRGRCEAGAELGMDDIHTLNALERRASKQRIDLGAVLKRGAYADGVRVSAMGPGDVLCHGCPWLEVGDVVDIAIEQADCSYRFKARVSWCAEDEQGDFDAVLAFLGIPVMLRRGPKSRVAPPSVVERIAA